MRTGTVIPAIIPQSPAHIGAMIEKVRSVVSEIQIDIVDGILAPFQSWPYRVTPRDGQEYTSAISALFALVPKDMSYELDLMIQEPRAVLPIWLATRPTRVVLHIESFSDDEFVREACALVREAGALAVVAAHNATPIERVLSLIPESDGVQCMGIAEIGRQGNPFDMRVLERIEAIRNAYPALSISIDGSVNTETIVSLWEAGANQFVVGSAIFDAHDSVEAYRALQLLVTAS